MILAALSFLLAMTSPDAVLTVLNSRNSVSAQKFAEANETVARDAKAGKTLQQFVVGVTTDDKALAEKYLNASRKKIAALAIEKNNALAWYLLSLERNDLRCLKKAADGGNVQALNALGTIVAQEAVGRESLSEERRQHLLAQSYGFFRQAALKNDPNGYINVGTCYLRGLGCKQDVARAFVCFKAAAEAGHPEGMDDLSESYRLGNGVEPNEELSLQWKMRARAARGDTAAAKWLEARK